MLDAFPLELSLDEKYPCRFCNFIEKAIGFDRLSSEDEEGYIQHPNCIHGLVP